MKGAGVLNKVVMGGEWGEEGSGHTRRYSSFAGWGEGAMGD